MSPKRINQTRPNFTQIGLLVCQFCYFQCKANQNGNSHLVQSETLWVETHLIKCYIPAPLQKTNSFGRLVLREKKVEIMKTKNHLAFTTTMNPQKQHMHRQTNYSLGSGNAKNLRFVGDKHGPEHVPKQQSHSLCFSTR